MCTGSLAGYMCACLWLFPSQGACTHAASVHAQEQIAVRTTILRRFDVVLPARRHLSHLSWQCQLKASSACRPLARWPCSPQRLLALMSASISHELGCFNRCVRADEVSATVRCHYLRTGAVNFTFVIRRREFFLPAGVVLKCLMDASDREIFHHLVASCPSV